MILTRNVQTLNRRWELTQKETGGNFWAVNAVPTPEVRS